MLCRQNEKHLKVSLEVKSVKIRIVIVLFHCMVMLRQSYHQLVLVLAVSGSDAVEPGVAVVLCNVPEAWL